MEPVWINMAAPPPRRFLLALCVFLSTAWGNQYQKFYQQHFYHPQKQQHQYIHPISPTQFPQSPAWTSTPPSASASSSSSSSSSAATASQPVKVPAYSSAQWGSNAHNQPHQHGTHVHPPHAHHTAHGSRVRPEDADIFARPYCATRRPGVKETMDGAAGAGGGSAAEGTGDQEVGECCPGRDDTCHVPILDTVCYCDVFCNRTVADCCPDFWSWCLGVEAPEGAMGQPGHLPHTKKKPFTNNCKYKDQYFQPNSSMRINCNNCTCAEATLSSEYNWKCTQKICLIRDELVDHVRKGDFGWHPSNYSYFWGLALDDGVQHKLGTMRPTKTVKKMSSMRVDSNDVLPDSFDAREEWPGLIHPIQDQGNCGASWAFSTTSVAADRFSLHSGGAVKDMPSPQHLLSCNRDHMQKGCDGGHLDRAWWYMRQTGVVDSHCYPYRSGQTADTGKCLVPQYRMRPPRVKCPTRKRRTSLLYQAAPPYRIAPNEREIMKELLENGPVQATMEVKEDFYMYKGGVYRYSLPANILPPNHRRTGFHSVRILGWGIDRSTGRPLRYWLCANSWGRKWGEDGYFRIARGQDECKIESFVVGVWGKINGRPIFRPRPSKGEPAWRRYENRNSTTTTTATTATTTTS